MRFELFLLALCAAAAVDLGDESTGVGFGEGVVFQLLAGEIGCEALEAGVVAQDPPVFGLCVAQGVAGEPFHAEVGVGAAG